MKTLSIWIGLALMAFITYIVWFPPKKTAIDYDRDAISNCWQGYEKKSLPSDTKLLVAKMCEDLEAKFVKEYNRKP